MRSPEDSEAFDTVIRDLCLAFNRPHTPELTRVFWEALKWAHIHDVRRAAVKHRNTAKKFPTPHDLMPSRSTAPPPAPKEPEPELSRYAIGANKALLKLAYQDVRRGFIPLGESLLARCLAIKRDYVGMAETAERDGEPWADEDFVQTVRQAFEQALGSAA